MCDIYEKIDIFIAVILLLWTYISWYSVVWWQVRRNFCPENEGYIFLRNPGFHLPEYMAPLARKAINKFKMSLQATSEQLKLIISTLMNIQFLLLPSIQLVINSRALNSEVDNLFAPTEKN
jgi:hypothetical protein